VPAPEVGKPLPRAEAAWSAPEKWTDWILADRGHLHDLYRVFGAVDQDMIWTALTSRIPTAPVDSVRPAGGGGVNCQVDLLLTFNGRTANVRSIWHYADENAPPKLATVFPTT
jgi:hypothetical protein